MTYQPYTLEVLSQITVPCEGCQSPTQLSSLTITPAWTVRVGRDAWRYECATCSRGKTDCYPVRLVDFLNGGETPIDWSTHLPGPLQAGEFLDCFYRLQTTVLSIIEIMDSPMQSPWWDTLIAQRLFENGMRLHQEDEVLGHEKLETTQKYVSNPSPRRLSFRPGANPALVLGLTSRSLKLHSTSTLPTRSSATVDSPEGPPSVEVFPPLAEEAGLSHGPGKNSQTRLAGGKRAHSRAAIALSAVVAFVGATAAVRPLLDNVHPVVPGTVYRSAQLDPEHLEAIITRYHIRSILNLRGARPGSRWYDDEVATAVRCGVDHADVELSPERDVPVSEAEKLVRLMDDLPKPLLIHSQVGADRSGLAAALYRYAELQDGASTAASQLSAWFGHVPLLRNGTAAMDRSFWAYVQSHRQREGT